MSSIEGGCTDISYNITELTAPNASRSLLNCTQGYGVTEWGLTLSQRVVFTTFAVVVGLLIQVANLGIIYYERVASGTYCTLLNKLATLVSVYQVGLVSVIVPVLVVRVLVGEGLDATLCWMTGVLFFFFICQMVLAYNEVVLMRYIYICKVKTVGTVKEELLLRVFMWINVALGTFISSLMGQTAQVNGHMMNAFCTNTAFDPGTEQKLLILLVSAIIANKA